MQIIQPYCSSTYSFILFIYLFYKDPCSVTIWSGLFYMSVAFFPLFLIIF